MRPPGAPRGAPRASVAREIERVVQRRVEHDDVEAARRRSAARRTTPPRARSAVRAREVGRAAAPSPSTRSSRRSSATAACAVERHAPAQPAVAGAEVEHAQRAPRPARRIGRDNVRHERVEACARAPPIAARADRRTQIRQREQLDAVECARPSDGAMRAVCRRGIAQRWLSGGHGGLGADVRSNSVEHVIAEAARAVARRRGRAARATAAAADDRRSTARPRSAARRRRCPAGVQAKPRARSRARRRAAR